jgi:hypothetical protein
MTRSVNNLDIIIGFTSGDIIWFDPLCNKYGRINKGVSKLVLFNTTEKLIIHLIGCYEFFSNYDDQVVTRL